MIKEIESTCLPQALTLVNEVFTEFVAGDYSEEGKRTFADYLAHKNEEVESDIRSEHKKLFGYYNGETPVGVIGMRDTSHIALLFVRKEYHRQGIAGKLFRFILDQFKTDQAVTKITVNSSPYAVEIYKRLGFTATDSRQEKDGIVFYPMAYKIEIRPDT